MHTHGQAAAAQAPVPAPATVRWAQPSPSATAHAHRHALGLPVPSPVPPPPPSLSLPPPLARTSCASCTSECIPAALMKEFQYLYPTRGKSNRRVQGAGCTAHTPCPCALPWLPRTVRQVLSSGAERGHVGDRAPKHTALPSYGTPPPSSRRMHHSISAQTCMHAYGTCDWALRPREVIGLNWSRGPLRGWLVGCGY